MKRIIEVTEGYYEWLKEKADNCKASVSDITILDSSPYEERQSGKWIPTVIDTGLYERSVCREWQCSNCGEVVKMKYPYCHCGAYMGAKEEAEE